MDLDFVNLLSDVAVVTVVTLVASFIVSINDRGSQTKVEIKDCKQHVWDNTSSGYLFCTECYLVPHLNNEK